MQSSFIRAVMVSFFIVLVIKNVFPLYSLIGLIALFVFFQQAISLYFNLGNQIPYRGIFGTMLSLQMLFGPSLIYNGLEDYQPLAFRMRVSETDYFYYVLPAVLFFLIGINIKGRNLGEVINVSQPEFSIINKESSAVPFVLIIIGFSCSIIQPYAPATLTFVFYLLSSLKYIGLFVLILEKKEIKLSLLILIYGSVISSSLAIAMFHDLLTWLIMLGAVLCIRYQFSNKTKLISATCFIILAILIQSVKGTYRDNIYLEGEAAGIESIGAAAEEVQLQTGGFFTIENLGPQVTRINQGWIVASIMNNVPSKEPFANGETLKLYLEAAFLPRFIAPDKLNAGSQEIFNKYSGHTILPGTSMALSSVGDGYINFGVVGGWIFMFFYGLLFNLVLIKIGKYSKDYPAVILFTTMIVIYPIRPDAELQTILGHLVKASFVVFIIFKFFGSHFKVEQEKSFNLI